MRNWLQLWKVGPSLLWKFFSLHLDATSNTINTNASKHQQLIAPAELVITSVRNTFIYLYSFEVDHFVQLWIFCKYVKIHTKFTKIFFAITVEKKSQIKKLGFSTEHFSSENYVGERFSFWIIRVLRQNTKRQNSRVSKYHRDKTPNCHSTIICKP